MTIKEMYKIRASLYGWKLTAASIIWAIAQCKIWCWLIEQYSWARYLCLGGRTALELWTTIVVLDALISYYYNRVSVILDKF